jgi:hypothetical protein
MSVARSPEDDPRLRTAADELRESIAARYPEATFELTSGDDPAGLYLIPTVDVEDTEEVAEVVADRLLALQVDEELPVYVFPVRPLARIRADLPNP